MIKTVFCEHVPFWSELLGAIARTKGRCWVASRDYVHVAVVFAGRFAVFGRLGYAGWPLLV